jgi:hypothetical protein
MDEQGLKALEEEQKKKLLGDLTARRETTLAEITPLEQQAKLQATTNRNAQNVASQVKKLNFAEFMANRGQTSAGLTGQAELSRQNVLARGIGETNQAEQTQLNQYGTQRANINTAFNQDLTSGNQAIALDTASKLLAYKEKLRQEKQARDEQLRREQLQQQEQFRQEALQQAEQLRREQVARDEATLSYNRSVAKSRSSGSYSPSSTTFTDTSKNNIVQNPVQRSVVQKQVVTPQLVKQEVTNLVKSGQMTQTEANRAYNNVLLTKGIFGR